MPSSFLKYIETTTKKKKTPAALREREKKRTNLFDAQREQNREDRSWAARTEEEKVTERSKEASATEKCRRHGERKGHEGKDKMSKRNNDSEAASASAFGHK